MYFWQIENFAYGEINERSFSNPHPWAVSLLWTFSRWWYLCDFIEIVMWCSVSDEARVILTLVSYSIYSSQIATLYVGAEMLLFEYNTVFVNHVGTETKYSERNKPIQWLLNTRRLASSGHQQL